MDCIVLRVSESQTQMSDFHFSGKYKRTLTSQFLYSLYKSHCATAFATRSTKAVPMRDTSF